MSKGKREAQCGYCGKTTQVTREHVVPRNLFPAGRMVNPVIIDACSACNGAAKSQDDEYLRECLIIDVRASKRPEARERLMGPVNRALRKGRSRLVRESLSNATWAPVHSEGGIYLGHAWHIPADSARLTRSLSSVARGLFFHMTSTILPSNYHCRIDRYFDYQLRDLVALMEANHMDVNTPENIDDGSVFAGWYKLKADDLATSFWVFRFYREIFYSLYFTPPNSSAS